MKILGIAVIALVVTVSVALAESPEAERFYKKYDTNTSINLMAPVELGLKFLLAPLSLLGKPLPVQVEWLNDLCVEITEHPNGNNGAPYGFYCPNFPKVPQGNQTPQWGGRRH